VGGAASWIAVPTAENLATLLKIKWKESVQPKTFTSPDFIVDFSKRAEPRSEVRKV